MSPKRNTSCFPGTDSNTPLSHLQQLEDETHVEHDKITHVDIKLDCCQMKLVPQMPSYVFMKLQKRFFDE